MPDPTIGILKKLLSLDTPVAVRIFEIALLLCLIAFAAYMSEDVRNPLVIIAAQTIGVFGVLAIMALIVVLIATIVRGLGKGTNRTTKQ